jgi:hypothetical protein
MNTISFTSKNPYTNKKHMLAWMLWSFILLLGLLAWISSLALYEASCIKELEQNLAQARTITASFNTYMQRKQELKTQELLLQKQRAGITQARHQSSSYKIILDHVQKELSKTASIDSLVLDPNTINLVIGCAHTRHTQDALTFCKQIPLIERVQVKSLKPTANGSTTLLQFSLQAILKKHSSIHDLPQEAKHA